TDPDSCSRPGCRAAAGGRIDDDHAGVGGRRDVTNVDPGGSDDAALVRDAAAAPPATVDATALTTLSDRADEGWRRLSARMLLVHPVQELRRAIIPLVVLIVFGRGDRNLWPYAAVLIVIALGLVRWFTTTY